MPEVSIGDLLDVPRPAARPDGPRRRPARGQDPAVLPPARGLRMTVGWGDFTRMPGHVHVTGHYQGVMPAAAEAALDRTVSRPGGRPLIAEHTRRRWLVGALGQITWFPAAGGQRRPDHRVRAAAVAGLGRVGTFTASSAALLYASLLNELDEVDGVTEVVVVPIGMGAGNLSAEQVAAAMVSGFTDALHASGGATGLVEQVTVVEIDRLRAEHLHRVLQAEAARGTQVQVTDELVTVEGGTFGRDAAAVLALRGLLRLSAPGAGRDEVVRAVVAQVPPELADQVAGGLQDLGAACSEVVDVRLASAERRAAAADSDTPPTRITARRTAAGLSWSALTAWATVPEREVALNETLVEDLVRRLTAPADDDARDLPRLLSRWVLPTDLRHHLTGETPLVIEVDVHTARLPWEFLLPEGAAADEDDPEPLAVRACLARQLRTSYARTDVQSGFHGPPRALVVADPGDPAKGDDLPMARSEGVTVTEALRGVGFVVEAFIGAIGTPLEEGARHATRLDVLTRLMTGRFDVVHYCGHGVFDPDRPDLAGWLFADGLLAARELSQLRRAPWLVVANACWSAARPATAAPASTSADAGGRAADLVPVLADEFLRAGVGHLVGTSWRVPDDGGRRFAEVLYGALLGAGGRAPTSVGQAVREARRDLWTRGRGSTGRPEVATSWAAYQHYGDPGDVFPRPDAEVVRAVREIVL